MKSLLLLTFFLAFISCNNINVQRENEPTIYNVSEDDIKMQEAIQRANHTLGQFNNALQSNDSAFQYFGLKVSFKAADRNEHIWVNSIWVKKDNYYGVIDNLPEYTSEVEQGDTIKIDKKKISDWMYLENSKLRGGYTIRVLRDRMSKNERQEFDQTSGMIIEN